MAGPPSGYVVVAVVIFGAVFVVLCLTVALFAWCDARHVAALRAGWTAPGTGLGTAPATAASTDPS